MKKIVFSTGAGISAPSGIPVYRGEGGTWTESSALEAKSNRDKFAEHMEELWRYWGAFRQRVANVEPNDAHLAVAELQNKADVHIITQNVDGLHQVAGSKRVAELHGSIWGARCSNSNCRARWDDHAIRYEPESCRLCKKGLSRPDVVLFGEDLRSKDWQNAQRACLFGPDYFIAVGTSGLVQPASELVSVAKKAGARTILINKDPWDYPSPDFDETILGDASEILRDVLAQL